MKKVILSLVCLLIAVPSFAAVTSVTLDWSKNKTMEGVVSCVAYNTTSSHFLVCQSNPGGAGGKRVAIVDATGENIIGYLPETGLTFGTLHVFSLSVADDGAVFGGGNPDPGTGETRTLYRWANESATPTQMTLGDVSSGMIFPRGMHAVNTGVNTVVASTGDNSYDVSVMTTTDGVNFSVAYRTNADADGAAGQIKNNVALLAQNPDKIVGCKADGAGQVVAIVRDGLGNWAALPGFTPPNSYTTAPAGLGAACLLGFSPGHNAIFTIGYNDAASDYLTTLDANTGAVIGTPIQIAQNVATYGYGSIRLMDGIGKGYFGSRQLTAGNLVAQFGVFSYNIPIPTATPTDTPTVTPTGTDTPTDTPTPTVTPTYTASTGITGFEVYE